MNGESCFTVQFLRLGEEEGGLGGGMGGGGQPLKSWDRVTHRD